MLTDKVIDSMEPGKGYTAQELSYLNEVSLLSIYNVMKHLAGPSYPDYAVVLRRGEYSRPTLEMVKRLYLPHGLDKLDQTS